MPRRRTAQMPLHGGKAPAWLFQRMAKLGGAITMAIVDEFGPAEMLRRLSDPWWFQAFGCVLGFDWHSSGVTTVTCGALREAAGELGDDLGILVAGGKGKTSRRTPAEIADHADRLGLQHGDRLIDYSKLSARVDSAAVQDGFTLYHHSFFFTPQGEWCVVQQGMSDAENAARRYHWLGESIDDFVCEPHQAISDLADNDPPAVDDASSACDLNMVAREADASRSASLDLIREHPDRILREVQLMTKGPSLFAPKHHQVLPENVNSRRLKQIIPQIHEATPDSYRQLLGLDGVGPATVRSLALVAEIIFQAPVCQRDPAVASAGAATGVSEDQTPQDAFTRRWADYSYAHGGKDGTPFPVDRATYDLNIHKLTEAIRKARMGEPDRFQALRRLSEITSASPNPVSDC